MEEPIATAAAQPRAAELYAQFCGGCHGADLQGGAGSSLGDNDWRFGSDEESIAASIRDGREEAGMPAMRHALSDDDIRELVGFLRSRSQSQIVAAADQGPDPHGMVVSSARHVFRIETLTQALDTPWGIDFLPDGRLLVTEKEGRLRLLADDSLHEDSVAGTPEVWHIGQGGLLDVAVHPEYVRNGWIYLAYSKQDVTGTGMVAVQRGRLRNHQWVDAEHIFQAPAGTGRPGGAQFGSRIAFDGYGYLFLTVGDREFADDAQDLRRPNGKILRLRDDGSIPFDNPFVGFAHTLPSIWSWGHRNPQGLAFDPSTGHLWSTEHGPRGGDELNWIHFGTNYGWPLATYGTNYDGTPVSQHVEGPGLQSPAAVWTPSIGISAITFYTGHRFPAWRGHLLLASLVQEELHRLEIVHGSVVHHETLLRGLGRIRDVTTGPDGCIYVALNLPDRIVRLVPADDGAPEPLVHQPTGPARRSI